MSYEPLHHKYRPQTFADLVGQSAIATTLSFAIKQSKIAPAYLFTGPRGTGKTSSARILAKSLNCLSSDRPTPTPCGKCEVCQAIARGSALDVMEIDAASNTGVDNIREIIERSQFAPVQSRYKVYAIDECLTGDSLVQTSMGLMRIDDPKLKGKLVLSYNENTKALEYKKVLRWLERGTKETLAIKTSNHLIRCTKNHLIRTDKGWIKAGNVKEGMKILSPVNVDAVKVSTNMAQMAEFADLLQDISLEAITNTQFPQWTTNLEKVEFVRHDGYEKVYDLEVEDNHNFVANGLLVHNCHMLSTAAFNALLKTLEEPPDRVVFVLATTDPQRVLSTIISRCQRFDFRRIPLAEMVSHLQYIATEEKIRITDEAVTLVAQIANGGLRDAESLLDQLSLLPELITVEQVWDLVGSVPEQDLLILLRAIAANQPEEVIEQSRNLLDRGREPLVVLQNLAAFYLNLLIAKTAPNRPDLVAVTETTWQNLCTQAQSWDTQEILRGQQHLKEAEVQIKNTTQPRLWLEVTLLGLLSLSSIVDREVHRQQPQIEKETIPLEKKAFDRVFCPPTAKVELPEANSITTPQASNVQTSSSQKLTSIPTNSPPPLVENGITPNSEVVAPDLSKVSKPKGELQTSVQAKQSPTPTELKTPNSLTPDISPQEVWKKAIDHLQPPTTQALFRQKCHLISLEGSVAVVGISSPQLLKLNQGKIPNLEAAFAQACERTIKVQLEVSTAESKSEILVSPKIQPPARQAPASSSIPKESRELSTDIPEKKTSTQDITTPQAEIKTNFPPQIEPNQEQEKTKIKEQKQAKLISSTENFAEIPQQVELDSVKLPTDNIEQNHNYSSDIDEQLQKAVETLAKNFEGEVVTIASAINNKAEEKNIEESEPDNLPEPKNDRDASEYQLEHLSAQKLATNHTSFNLNQSSLTPKPILHNRPDLSEYEDDDDVPFVRPIYSKTNTGKELCDSWELEANHYWDRFKN